MLAKDTHEGQLYILPDRLDSEIAMQCGWNNSGLFLLFLINSGKKRIIKTVLPNEEVRDYKWKTSF